MMPTTQWGRKETIIFPPHSPIYSYGAVFLAFVLTGFFLYLRFAYGQTPLQQFYTPIYVRSAVGDGIGFKTTEAKEMMRIPIQAEAQHIELMGDTGAGKTALIMQVLRQVQARGQSAIVYDPACEFIQRFYDQRRGDIVLNPLDDRCPYWGPSEELRRKAEAKAIAASLYQPTNDRKGEFFTETPQKIFAHLLTYGPSPQQLIAWLSSALSKRNPYCPPREAATSGRAV